MSLLDYELNRNDTDEPINYAKLMGATAKVERAFDNLECTVTYKGDTLFPSYIVFFTDTKTGIGTSVPIPRDEAPMNVAQKMTNVSEVNNPT